MMIKDGENRMGCNMNNQLAPSAAGLHTIGSD